MPLWVCVGFVLALLVAGSEATEASGAPTQGVPGSPGFGNLEQGQLEASNVNVVNEMVNMIQAQRAYEINSRVVSSSDAMLGRLAQL